MKMNRVLIGIAISVTVAGTIAMVVRNEMATLRRSETYSSVTSMAHELAATQILTDLHISQKPEWRLLSEQEYRTVIAELARRSRLDVGRGTVVDAAGLLDPWGIPYRVAVKQESNHSALVIVWSMGADRMSGTDDDLISSRSDWGTLPVELRRP